MKPLLLACALALGLLTLGQTPAQAQDAMAENPAIRGTISKQLQAFERGDVPDAFSHASPSLRRYFGSPERFGAMVQQGYPMVWQPGASRFGPLLNLESGLWQEVIITDTGGQAHVLRYRMQQVEGDWRISSVVIMPPPDIGV